MAIVNAQGKVVALTASDKPVYGADKNTAIGYLTSQGAIVTRGESGFQPVTSNKGEVLGAGTGGSWAGANVRAQLAPQTPMAYTQVSPVIAQAPPPMVGKPEAKQFDLTKEATLADQQHVAEITGLPLVTIQTHWNEYKSKLGGASYSSLAATGLAQATEQATKTGKGSAYVGGFGNIEVTASQTIAQSVPKTISTGEGRYSGIFTPEAYTQATQGKIGLLGTIAPKDIFKTETYTNATTQTINPNAQALRFNLPGVSDTYTPKQPQTSEQKLADYSSQISNIQLAFNSPASLIPQSILARTSFGGGGARGNTETNKFITGFAVGTKDLSANTLLAYSIDTAFEKWYSEKINEPSLTFAGANIKAGKQPASDLFFTNQKIYQPTTNVDYFVRGVGGVFAGTAKDITKTAVVGFNTALQTGAAANIGLRTKLGAPVSKEELNLYERLTTKEIPAGIVETAFVPATYFAAGKFIEAGGTFAYAISPALKQMPVAGNLISITVKNPLIAKGAGQTVAAGALVAIPQFVTAGNKPLPVIAGESAGIVGLFYAGAKIPEVVGKGISEKFPENAFTKTEFVSKAEAQSRVESGLLKQSEMVKGIEVTKGLVEGYTNKILQLTGEAKSLELQKQSLQYADIFKKESNIFGEIIRYKQLTTYFEKPEFFGIQMAETKISIYETKLADLRTQFTTPIEPKPYSSYDVKIADINKQIANYQTQVEFLSKPTISKSNIEAGRLEALNTIFTPSKEPLVRFEYQPRTTITELGKMPNSPFSFIETTYTTKSLLELQIGARGEELFLKPLPEFSQTKVTTSFEPVFPGLQESIFKTTTSTSENIFTISSANNIPSLDKSTLPAFKFSPVEKVALPTSIPFEFRGATATIFAKPSFLSYPRQTTEQSISYTNTIAESIKQMQGTTTRSVATTQTQNLIQYATQLQMPTRTTVQTPTRTLLETSLITQTPTRTLVRTDIRTQLETALQTRTQTKTPTRLAIETRIPTTVWQLPKLKRTETPNFFNLKTKKPKPGKPAYQPSILANILNIKTKLPKGINTKTFGGLELRKQSAIQPKPKNYIKNVNYVKKLRTKETKPNTKRFVSPLVSFKSFKRR